MKSVKANLVVRPEKLGDLVVATPVFRAFKESYPDQPLHLLTDEIYADVVRHDPHLDKIIPMRWKGRSRDRRESWLSIYRKLKPYRYERAALLYYNVEGFNWLAAALRVPHVAQLGGTISAYLFGHGQIRRQRFRERRHYAEWYLRVAELLGARTGKQGPALYILPGEIEAFKNRFPFLRERRKRVILHPFSHGSAPNYSLEAYLRLAERLMADSSLDLFVTGMPAELEVWRRLAGSSRARTDWLGTLSIREWMAASTQVNLVVAGSTGVIHVSAALGVPTLGPYCPHIGCHPDMWGPVGPATHTLIAPETECFGIVGERARCWENGSCELSRVIPLELLYQKAVELLASASACPSLEPPMTTLA
jgi:ADP-heptose:LPS heptosyltransferase